MTLPQLLMVWSVALVLALAAVAVLSRALWVLLVDICGTRQRAQFWTLYATVLMVATPLLTVSIPGRLDEVAARGALAPLLQRTLFFSLGGTIGALVIMGLAVWRPIARSIAAGAVPDSADPAPRVDVLERHPGT